MIRVVKVKDVQTEIEVTHTDEVKTYNLVTGFMSDECKPYRVAQSAMIWLSCTGEIGEVECIFPRVVDTSPCIMSEQVINQVGFPELEITSLDNDVCVEHHVEGFTIWFAMGKVINAQIQIENITFLLTDTELAGITCREIEKI